MFPHSSLPTHSTSWKAIQEASQQTPGAFMQDSVGATFILGLCLSRSIRKGVIEMFHEENCDLCGDCLVECKYIDYDREAAIAEFSALIEGRPTNIVQDCITCAACNETCPQDANPFDLICRTQEETNALAVPEAVVQSFDSMCKGENEVKKGCARQAGDLFLHCRTWPAAASRGFVVR